MCGYLGNLIDSPVVLELLVQLGIDIYPLTRSYNRRTLDGLISASTSGYEVSSAIWWYKLMTTAKGLEIDPKITSFNARDLTKPLWKNAVKTRRGLVFATEIGESNGSHRYLMRASTVFAIGTLYKDWIDSEGNTKRSVAVITRPPHERFSQYHEKSIPCFLPLDFNIIREWLDPKIESSPIIDDILERPRIYTAMEVQKVKTYKDAAPLGDAEILDAD